MRTLRWSQVTSLARALFSDRVPILCFHGVTHRATRAAADPLGLHVRARNFSNQLEYLKRSWQVIALEDYLGRRPDLPQRAVVITFDDGYRNFLTAAAPALLHHRLPATLFVVTDRMGDRSGEGAPDWNPADDVDYLSWEELRRVAALPGISVGSHTCTHARLSEVPFQAAESELRQSREALLRNLGPGPFPFAYPYGLWSDQVAAAAKSTGYTCALTTDDGPNQSTQDAFLLRRTLVGDDDDPAVLEARLSGVAHVGRELAGALRRWPSRADVKA